MAPVIVTASVHPTFAGSAYKPDSPDKPGDPGDGPMDGMDGMDGMHGGSGMNGDGGNGTDKTFLNPLDRFRGVAPDLPVGKRFH